MNSNRQTELDALAFQAFDLLRASQQVLVTAESCTAGLIAATLSRVPGMSAYLAGSFVVYQIDSKIEWLNVPAELIERCDVVSAEVAECMAIQSLQKTPHATMAISITGHLGPDAPGDLDGIAWFAIAIREPEVSSMKLELHSVASTIPSPHQHLFIRHERQQDAVIQSLGFLCRRLTDLRQVRLM